MPLSSALDGMPFKVITDHASLKWPNCSESHGQFFEVSRDSASETGNAGHAQ